MSPIRIEELLQTRALFCRKSTMHWTLLLQQVSWAQHQGEQFPDQPCFSKYNSDPKNSTGQAEGLRGCSLRWTMLPLQENGRGEGIQKHWGKIHLHKLMHAHKVLFKWRCLFQFPTSRKLTVTKWTSACGTKIGVRREIRISRVSGSATITENMDYLIHKQKTLWKLPEPLILHALAWKTS